MATFRPCKGSATHNRIAPSCIFSTVMCPKGRATGLTDAGILLVPGPVLPEGVDIAALLRWPTGPQTPET
jgi:hypothetical protein